MIIQINIPDDAIKQEKDIDNEDIINIIFSGINYMFRVSCNHHIANSNFTVTIKE